MNDASNINQDTQSETQPESQPDTQFQTGFNNIESAILNLLDSYESSMQDLNGTTGGIRDGFLPSITLNTSSSTNNIFQSNVFDISTNLSNSNTNNNSTLSMLYNLFTQQGNLERTGTNSFRNLFETSQEDFTNIINETLNDPSQNVYKNILSEEGEKIIKTMKYEKEKYKEQTSCTITLNKFEEGDEIACLPCEHIFNKDAILKWLKNEDSRCPVCRKKLPSNEVRKKNEINNIDITTINTTTLPNIISSTSILTTPAPPSVLPPAPPSVLPPAPEALSIPLPPTPPTHPPTPPTPPTRNSFFRNLIQENLRREEERLLEEAIMASLRDIN